MPHKSAGNFPAPAPHYWGMECETVREAISAWLDGEDAGRPAGAVEAHLETCAACRAWREQAHEVTRRARLGGPSLDRDLTPAVLAATRATSPTGRSRSQPGEGLPGQAHPGQERQGLDLGWAHPGWAQPGWAYRAALLAVAVAQLGITVPLLLLGHDHDAGRHAAHELGSFDLALAVAFILGALRPALCAGLAWPCGIAALGLAGTAVLDWAGGQAPGADEAQHLVAVAGAALLFWQARAGRTGRGDRAPAVLPGDSGAIDEPAGWRSVAQPGSQARPGHGAGAAGRREHAA